MHSVTVPIPVNATTVFFIVNPRTVIGPVHINMPKEGERLISLGNSATVMLTVLPFALVDIGQIGGAVFFVLTVAFINAKATFLSFNPIAFVLRTVIPRVFAFSVTGAVYHFTFIDAIIIFHTLDLCAGCGLNAL